VFDVLKRNTPLIQAVKQRLQDAITLVYIKAMLITEHTLSKASIEAPLSNNARATATESNLAATCSGVCPSCMFRSAQIQCQKGSKHIRLCRWQVMARIQQENKPKGAAGCQQVSVFHIVYAYHEWYRSITSHAHTLSFAFTEAPLLSSS
jgi:hypothetical protein